MKLQLKIYVILILIDDGEKISLYYDDSFNSPKLVTNEIFGIHEFLKIDPNTFIYSSKGIFSHSFCLPNKQFSNNLTKFIFVKKFSKILFLSISSFGFILMASNNI